RPWQMILGPNRNFGSVRLRMVEGRDRDVDRRRSFVVLKKERGPATGREGAYSVRMSHLAQVAGQNRHIGDPHDTPRDKRCRTPPSAIDAVTITDPHGLVAQPVTGATAQTAALDGLIHFFKSRSHKSATANGSQEIRFLSHDWLQRQVEWRRRQFQPASAPTIA